MQFLSAYVKNLEYGPNQQIEANRKQTRVKAHSLSIILFLDLGSAGATSGARRP